jgi:LCP family protein required for cell wall assembly
MVTAFRLFCGLLSVLVLTGSAWGWYLTQLAEASVTRTDAIPTTGNTDAQGSAHAGREMNLLLVGRDSRTGLTAQQRQELSAGDEDGLLNTDTMILVHLPSDGSSASFVSIPRDLYVPIPGHGSGKLNSAYGDGYNSAGGSDVDRATAGQQLLIQTISQVTGVQIDHYAEVDLLGFVNLSTIVGDVQVNLCRAVDDPASGARFPAGVQSIGGADALKFVRQRDGLPRTDLDREVRQQVYIGGLLRNILSQHLLLNLSGQQRIVQQLGGSITVDRGLDLFELASQMQSVQLDHIQFQTVPGLTDGHEGTWGSVLEPPSHDQLVAWFASLGAPAAPAVPAVPAPTAAPADVTVSVLNGSGVSGAAARAATDLTSAGFAATSGNAPAGTAQTTVRYPTGSEAQAATLAAAVPGAVSTADDTVPAGTVQLVLGSDFNGIGTAVTATGDLVDVPNSYATTQRTAQDTSCIY